MASADPPDLPPVGPELTLRVHAGEAALRLGDDDVVVRLDLAGTIRMTVEEQLRYGPPGMKLRVGAVDLAGDDDTLGNVSLSLGDDDVAMLSRVELVGGPARLRHVMAFEVTLTIERPPGGGPPLELTTAQPASLVCAGLEAFPPSQEARYEMQGPVELTPKGVYHEAAGELIELTLVVSAST